jgi:hypothetical protein
MIARRCLLTAPVLATFVFVGGILLRVYAPTSAAANFTSPQWVAHGIASSDYAVVALRNGWGMVETDHANRLTYSTFSANQRRESSTRVLDRSAAQDGMPAVARTGSAVLAVWVNSVGSNASRLVGMSVGARPDQKAFTIVPPVGTVEHPDVFTVGDRFDVVFSWQRSGLFNIYLASVSPRMGRVLFVRRLVHATGYGFYPRAVADDGGSIFLAYMDQCCKPRTWEVHVRRFSASGRSIGRDTVVTDVPELTGASGEPPVIPTQWGIAVARGPDGSIWAAWEANNSLSLSRWSNRGRMLSDNTVLAGGLNTDYPAVQVVPRMRGGLVFVGADDGLQTQITSVTFDGGGKAGRPQRVEYTPGASIQNPVAVSDDGHVLVVWHSVPDGSYIAGVATSLYGVGHVSSIAAQFGLSSGNPWGVLAILLAVAAFGGAAVTVVNIFIVVPLIAAWLPVGRLISERYQWIAYSGVIGLALTLAFSVRTIVSSAALVIVPFRSHSGWLVAIGAVFVGYWIGRKALANQDAIFRAAGTVLMAFYFVGFMWALVGLEGGLGPM